MGKGVWHRVILFTFSNRPHSQVNVQPHQSELKSGIITGLVCSFQWSLYRLKINCTSYKWYLHRWRSWVMMFLIGTSDPGLLNLKPDSKATRVGTHTCRKHKACANFFLSSCFVYLRIFSPGNVVLLDHLKLKVISVSGSALCQMSVCRRTRERIRADAFAKGWAFKMRVGLQKSETLMTHSRAKIIQIDMS